ncbi:hypothetical protein PENSPDRAFT_695083 [Peniophora sp. CONT]|nr:hypothetical protein PENSPDRAFT_695083 [Peniophora sp. CONT]
MSDTECENLSSTSSSLGTTAHVCDASPSPYIDRLPIELLCRIFCWLPRFDDEDSGVSINARTPTWVPVLHVCSSWRVIATECKELWSWIPLGHPKWTEIALRLSDPLLIAVRIPGEYIFARLVDDTPVVHRLLKDAFALVINHLPRVWHLDLTMSRHESSDEVDGEAHAEYVCAREMLAPLRNARMNQLVGFRCSRADLRVGSFFDDTWASHIRHLNLSGCIMPKCLGLSHLPLVILIVNIPCYNDGFVPWLTFLASLPESLEMLTIWDALKPSHLDEVPDDASPSWEPRIKLPRLKELYLMRSPLLMGYYIRYFDIPHTAQLLLLWWAADFDVPEAILPDYAATASWPIIDDWGEMTHTLDQEHKLFWLGLHMCKALLAYIYGVVIDGQHDVFDPLTYTLGKVYEKDEHYTVTMNGIGWAPVSSTLVALWAKGTQTLYQDVFGVCSIKSCAEWARLFDVMRAYGARKGRTGDPAPAAFFSAFEEISLKRLKEERPRTLTLVALHCLDFTNPILNTYFPVLLHLLYRSDYERDPIFPISILFPFGLKLSDEQRKEIMKYNITISDFVEEYMYTEFKNTES